MARWSGATWRPVRNHGGARPRGQPSVVVLHHAVAVGSLFGVFNGSRQASTDFWIARDGRCEQYVDTAMTSWGNGNANANQRGISVETEGCASPPHAEPMTEAMINTFARLMAWANQTHGVPLRLTDSYNTPGFGYHRMAGGPATGCPCDVRKNTRSEILRRAQGGAPAPEPPRPEETEMMTSAVADDGTLHVWTVGPARQTAWLTFQRPNQNAWWGGQAGRRIAGFFKFADAPKGRTIRGITCERAANGNLNWFMTLDTGDVWFRWQGRGSTDWSPLSMFGPWG
jgi:hypothetical protein